jgi:cysteinyl-tRNA synthetase
MKYEAGMLTCKLLDANMLTLNGKKNGRSLLVTIFYQEILTGDNSILSKAFSASVARFLCYKRTLFLIFRDDAIVAKKDIKG